jgi:polyhydroxyalkanoate synthase
MSDSKNQLQTEFKLPDPVKLAQNLAQVFARASEIAKQVAARPDLQKAENEAQILPMEQVAKTLGALTSYYSNEPQKLMQAQMKLWSGYTVLWQGAWAKALGQPAETLATPARNDRRFKDKDWQDNAYYDLLKQAYLITTNWAAEMVQEAELEPHTKQKAKFYVEQITNALAPSNFVFSNPEVLKATLASNGANLISGMEKLERDFKSPDGRLRITQTDKSAFEVGRNIALTPGKVIFRNDVFELIQYAPSTKKVFEIPLLIVPPWINKFYILDLTPQKSYIKWCVDNGITVFVMSWVNASDAHGRKSFADYMHQGFLTAISEIQKATGTKKVNSVGFCIGGTLVAASLGYMAAKNDNRVNAATFFTTQVDFEKAGDLCVYVDEEQVRWIESRMDDKGYLPGSRMADAFNLLRANDLIWSNVVNNYLLGKDPMPFDLLYWNADSTRMPAAVHSFYLRECYMENKLAKGTMVLDDMPIDLSKVKIPIYNLAAKEDHIAPLPSVYRLAEFFGGPVKMVVSGSGHIAGVVNPPAAGKYQYWTNDNVVQTLEDWLSGATETTGSWWPNWLEWIVEKSGKKITARQVVNGLCDAPGEFVKVKGD